MLLFNPGRSREFLCGLLPDLPASAAHNRSLTIALKQVTTTTVHPVICAHIHIGWRWAGFGNRRAADMSSMRRGPGLPHARYSCFQLVTTTGYGWNHPPGWQWLFENIFKTGQKTAGKEKRREQKEWEAAEGMPKWEEEQKKVLHSEADIPRGTAAHLGSMPEQRKRERRSGRVKPLRLDCNPPCTTYCLTEVTECNLQPVHDPLVFILTREFSCSLVLPIFSPGPAGEWGWGQAAGWEVGGQMGPTHHNMSLLMSW